MEQALRAVTDEDAGGFIWVQLNEGDERILEATATRLVQADGAMQSCHFVHEVLLEDFPAEVFLQRPAVLQALLDVLTSNLLLRMAMAGQREAAQELPLATLRCLEALWTRIAARQAVLLDHQRTFIPYGSDTPGDTSSPLPELACVGALMVRSVLPRVASTELAAAASSVIRAVLTALQPDPAVRTAPLLDTCRTLVADGLALLATLTAPPAGGLSAVGLVLLAKVTEAHDVCAKEAAAVAAVAAGATETGVGVVSPPSIIAAAAAPVLEALIDDACLRYHRPELHASCVTMLRGCEGGVAAAQRAEAALDAASAVEAALEFVASQTFAASHKLNRSATASESLDAAWRGVPGLEHLAPASADVFVATFLDTVACASASERNDELVFVAREQLLCLLISPAVNVREAAHAQLLSALQRAGTEVEAALDESELELGLAGAELLGGNHDKSSALAHSNILRQVASGVDYAFHLLFWSLDENEDDAIRASGVALLIEFFTRRGAQTEAEQIARALAPLIVCVLDEPGLAPELRALLADVAADPEVCESEKSAMVLRALFHNNAGVRAWGMSGILERWGAQLAGLPDDVLIIPEPVRATTLRDAATAAMMTDRPAQARELHKILLNPDLAYALKASAAQQLALVTHRPATCVAVAREGLHTDIIGLLRDLCAPLLTRDEAVEAVGLWDSDQSRAAAGCLAVLTHLLQHVPELREAILKAEDSAMQCALTAILLADGADEVRAQAAAFICVSIFTDAEFRVLPNTKRRVARHPAYYELDEFYTLSHVPSMGASTMASGRAELVVWLNLPAPLSKQLVMPLPTRVFAMTSRQHRQIGAPVASQYTSLLRGAHWFARTGDGRRGGGDSGGSSAAGFDGELYGDEPDQLTLLRSADLDHAARMDELLVTLQTVTSHPRSSSVLLRALAALEFQVCALPGGARTFLTRTSWRNTFDHLLGAFPVTPAYGEIIAEATRLLTAVFSGSGGDDLHGPQSSSDSGTSAGSGSSANAGASFSNVSADDIAWLTRTAESRLHLLLEPDLNIGEAKMEARGSENGALDVVASSAPITRRLHCNVLSLLVTLMRESHRRDISVHLPLCNQVVMQRIGLVGGADGHVYHDLSLLALSLRFMLYTTSAALRLAVAGHDASADDATNTAFLDKADLRALQVMLTACVNTFTMVSGEDNSGAIEIETFTQKGVCRLAMQCAAHVSAIRVAAEGLTSAAAAEGDIHSPVPAVEWAWEGSLSWLAALCGSRDERLRLAAFSAIGDQSVTVDGADVICALGFGLEGDRNLTLLEAVFGALLDTYECASVRCAASSILVNLCVHGRVPISLARNESGAGEEFVAVDEKLKEAEEEENGSVKSNTENTEDAVKVSAAVGEAASSDPHVHTHTVTNVSSASLEADDGATIGLPDFAHPLVRALEPYGLFVNAGALLDTSHGHALPTVVGQLLLNLLIRAPDEVLPLMTQYHVWSRITTSLREASVAVVSASTSDTAAPAAALHIQLLELLGQALTAARTENMPQAFAMKLVRAPGTVGTALNAVVAMANVGNAPYSVALRMATRLFDYLAHALVAYPVVCGAVWDSIIPEWSSVVRAMKLCFDLEAGAGAGAAAACRAAATFLVALLPRDAGATKASRMSLDQPTSLLGNGGDVAVSCNNESTNELTDEGNPGWENDVGTLLSMYLCGALRHLLAIAAREGTTRGYPAAVRTCTTAALTALMGASLSARRAFLRAGMLDEIMRHVGEVHACLALETSARRGQAALTELASALRLLQNLMLRCASARVACLEAGLVHALTNLWPSCQLEPRLRVAWLQTLTNLCARCPPAKRAIKPLLPRICRIITGPKPGGPLMRAALSAVCAAASVSACRAVLWKEGMLRACADLTTSRDAFVRRQALAVVFSLSHLEGHPAIVSVALPVFGRVLVNAEDAQCAALADRGVRALAKIYAQQVRKGLAASRARWRSQVAAAAGILTAV